MGEYTDGDGAADARNQQNCDEPPAYDDDPLLMRIRTDSPSLIMESNYPLRTCPGCGMIAYGNEPCVRCYARSLER